jgi:hypothetical protein
METGAPVQDGLACEGTICVENWWRVGAHGWVPVWGK